MRDTFLVLILGPEKVSFISEVYFIDKTASRRAWHLPGRWPDGGRRSTVARWTRRCAAPAYAAIPDLTPDLTYMHDISQRSATFSGNVFPSSTLDDFCPTFPNNEGDFSDRNRPSDLTAFNGPYR